MTPSDRQPGLFGTVLPEEEDQFAFQDRNIPLNFAEDASTMVKDTIVDPVRNAVGNMEMPGLMGLFGRFGESLGNNRADHRYINSLLGRASPDKNMAFFNQASYDATKNLTPEQIESFKRGELSPDVLGNLPGADINSGSSLGQAVKYFKRAGITDNDLRKFSDPRSKFYGNEAYLSSRAGGEGAEDFATGMSFIKNAKASANLARNLAAQQQADAAARGVSGVSYAEPDLVNDDILYGEPGYGMGDVTSGISYTDPDLVNDDILYGEPGNMGFRGNEILDQDADFYNYPDEQYLGMLNRRDPAAMYEGVYPSPITDTMYDDDLSPDAIRGGFTDNRLYNEMPIKVPGLPLHARPIYKPRDTIGITEMGGGFNALPLLDPEEEEEFIHPRLR